jgi:nitrate/nitrite transport system substrate-binding protein
VVESARDARAVPARRKRRNFIRAVGRRTAMAAISSFLPLGALEAMASQEKKARWKRPGLKIGFIPITCATPIIMADPLGFYKKQGLNVSMIKTAGWALIRDKVMNRNTTPPHAVADAAGDFEHGRRLQPHALNVPASRTSTARPSRCTVKHKDKRDPKNWKGFKFAVPFDYSMHNYLLRYYLAEHGIDPDTDVQIRACRRRKWWPTCAPATSTASSARTR